ncbi:hypothetical protein [Pelagicoccus sp. SDUM812003]|uniref:hypothetical protein n=1 Tax=Pelagicoccus sp. SDUM812003 TaxID=3041267 RepID=UPI00280EBC88|nr:hypothetical protein [Pelagicoccus sp. SDUM812003]MDQ8205607.1 hypothetical protein [Pelagicoccus sp. SDUM812003]
MDFELVVQRVLGGFEEAGVRYGLIGGYALGLWGATRATIDLDFLLLVDDLQKAEAILGEFSYQCVFKSENVAQYASDLAPFGQIDVLIARREISKGMLKRSVGRESAAGAMRVLQPEDLIGLKLQALVNDPSREAGELEDMRALLRAAKSVGRGVDWELLEDYFGLFDRTETLERLRSEHG